MTKDHMNQLPRWLLPHTIPLFPAAEKREHTPWKTEAEKAAAENRKALGARAKKQKVPKL